ncbi:hypothetical protein GCM10011521_04720 [Arenimonas soli]|uniref:TonB C-terminal domain-containing protein n=1 Tax=Arenimonas soli TaxID=2269504 RepID=A0ABQ1HCI4_9GAMM|nr:hypothetical protein [Arenimonas soli]GGA69566.1 hypothetical protein GCM10011521_04720 [Arenimonas soli]
MKRLFACTVALALAACLSPARADDAALPFCAPEDLTAQPINPDGDRALRLATAAGWEAEGAQANSFEKLQLGSFYRLGRSHPAALLERDTAKARALLAHAALGGQLTAMAASAELELENGDPMAGMVWAQLYAHYMQRQFPTRFRAYQADLLRRAFDALPRGDRTAQEIEAQTGGFLATYGAQIDAALVPGGDDGGGPAPDCRPVHEVYTTQLELDQPRVPLAGGRNTVNRYRMYEPGLALYKLHVSPSGEVVRAMVVESLPGPAAGKGLMRSVMRLRFNAVDEDAPIRVVLLPMSFDDHSVKFRD